MNWLGKACGMLHGSVRWLSLSHTRNASSALTALLVQLYISDVGAPCAFLIMRSMQAHHRPTHRRLPPARIAASTA
jgi:hypothetical protein